MEEVRDFATIELIKHFSEFGENAERILYNSVCLQFINRCGWDFAPFRKEYRRMLFSVLSNLSRKDGQLKKTLLECYEKSPELFESLFQEKMKMDCRFWEPTLWTLFKEASEEDTEELREGTFSCSNCARRNVYQWNTSHYEKQIRSSDEPMTLFIHCHTCGKDYRKSS